MTDTSPAAFGPGDTDALRAAVREAVAAAPVFDMHTHLFAPAFGPLLLWGPDDLLTYHYLTAEYLRATREAPGPFLALSKEEQAEATWRTLFLERPPLSEACRGVLTALQALGFDPAERSLEALRAAFRERDTASHVQAVFRAAGVSAAVMTNDPFDPVERAAWEAGYEPGGLFEAALRIDTLLLHWGRACPLLRAMGYDTEQGLGPRTLAEVCRFLEDALRRMRARYLAVSLPPDFAYPDETPCGTLLTHCVLPVARAAGKPLALMIGVRRGVNPALGLAGDGVGRADVPALERLCADYPDNRFLATLLARENQHALAVAGRKFSNLLVFGCWWFLNNPSLVAETTRMRLEMLGPTFVAQHSDARVLEQVLYKWRHARAVIGDVLADAFAAVAATGRPIALDEVNRAAALLLGGAFREFAA